MKTKKITYWLATSLVGLVLFGSGAAYLSGSEVMAENFQRMGYPLYFMSLLGVWKVLGAVALLTPGFPRITEWAYAGAFFTFSSAIVSHVAAGEALTVAIPAVVALTSLAVSYGLRSARSATQPEPQHVTRPRGLRGLSAAEG